MKFILKLTTIFVVLTSLSCEKKVALTQFEEHICSEQLEIIVDEIHVIIDKETKSGIYQRYKKSAEVIIETKNFILTKSEIDKLFKNSFELIKSTNYKLTVLTCFAGQNFKLRLNCSNKTLEFHENSVKKWSEISIQTTEIRNILKSKITIVE